MIKVGNAMINPTKIICLGDLIEATIENIGTLINKVILEGEEENL